MCDKIECDTIPPVAEHDYKLVKVAATCVEAGYDVYECIYCESSYKDEASLTGFADHSYEEITVAPTVNERGYTRYECANCGNYYDDDYTEMLCSEELEFVLSSDRKFYSVTGISALPEDGVLYIPSVYQNLSVTEIAESAFEGEGIVAAVLGDNIVTIGASAFKNCTALESVNIPLSVESIGKDAFSRCIALTEIIYQARSVSKCPTGIFYNAGAEGGGITLTVGAEVEIIPSGLFYVSNATGGGSTSPKIVSVVFEEGCALSEIGSAAFAFCIWLEYICLPSTVLKIGAEAFYGCTSLKYAVVADGATIGNGAFSNVAAGFEIIYI